MAKQLKWKWALIALLVTGSIGYTSWKGGNHRISAAASVTAAPQIGYRLPGFEMKLLFSDGIISNKDFLGKPVFINFWTSWCTYCRLEASDIEKAYQKYGNQVVFLSVNVTSQDSMPAIEAFAKQYGMTWKIPLDTTGQVAQKFKIIAFPTSFFVSRNGLIEDKVIGSLSSGTLNQDLEAISK